MIVDFSVLEDDDSEIVKVSDVVWTALSLGEGRVAIALSEPAGVPGGQNEHSLITWACKSPEIHGVCVPKHLTDRYQEVLQQNGGKDDKMRVSVTSVTPIALDEVILLAKSPSAYAMAGENSDLLKAQLVRDKTILRQGNDISLNSVPAIGNGHAGNQTASFKLEYKVVLTAPVHQGYVDVDSTEIYIAPDEPEVDQGSPALVPDSTGSSSDEEDSDIDESFLLNSLSKPNGGTKSRDNGAMDAPDSTLFKPVPLRASHLLRNDGLQDLTILLRTADLARLGIFSGDWLVICNRENRSKSRIVRILGIESHDNVIEPGSILLPPLLFHNIDLDSTRTPIVEVQKTAFGSQIPPVPAARSITLARIASPPSVQKRYQQLVLWALRKYLQESRRLLKQGDTVAVALNSSLSTLFEGVTEKEGKHSVFADELIQQLQSTGESPDEVAFFRVTHIEHDLVQVKANGSLDAHFAAVMGELGCWFDPETTRLVQSGLENSRVPDLDEFLGIRRRHPLLGLHGQKSVWESPDTPFGNLRDIVAATLHQKASEYKLTATVLVAGNAGTGKRTLVRWVARSLGIHMIEFDCFDIVDDTEVKTEGILKARFEQAEEISPSILLLRNVDALVRKNQKAETGKEPAIASVLKECLIMLEMARSRTGFPTAVVATARDKDTVPLSVLACFKHQITVEAPDETQRLAILRGLLHGSSISPDVSLESIATQTAALVAADLADVTSLAHTAASERIWDLCRKQGHSPRDAQLAGFSIMGVDFERALTQARATFSANIGAPSIPKVSWDDVGGLASVKSDILDTIQLPLQHPEVFADGMKKRSGVLLFGPPGTGKTLLAKAVATSFALNFFSVKGPELLNMYIGESEANVRRVFQRARDARPCVIFFDELDSVAPKRGNQGDSGGVMDRIVSQLLAELDGMSDGSGADVFVIGATNRPDLLDPALLRPGRFDKLLYLGVSDTHESQLKIIEALTRKFRLDTNLDLREIAEQCSFNFTGADFYALCSDAMLKAMTRKAASVDAKIALINSQPRDPAHVYPITPQYYLAEMSTEEDTDITVNREDFLAALKELVPSVSQTEMEHYRKVQEKFADNSKRSEDQDQSPPQEREGIQVPADRKGKGRAT